MSTVTDNAIPTWGEVKLLAGDGWQLIAKSNGYKNDTFGIVELNSIKFDVVESDIISTLLGKSSFEYSIDFWSATTVSNDKFVTAHCQTYNIASGLYIKSSIWRTIASKIQITNITPCVGDDIGIIGITIGIDVDNGNAIFEVEGNTLMPPTEHQTSYIFIHAKF